MGVVPELTERPGAEYFTESWLRQVRDRYTAASGCCSKRVWRATSSSLIGRFSSLMIAHQRRDGRSEGVLNRSRRAEIVAAEALLYPAGGRIEVASPSAGFERGAYLGKGKAGAHAGGGRPTQEAPQRHDGPGPSKVFPALPGSTRAARCGPGWCDAALAQIRF